MLQPLAEEMASYELCVCFSPFIFNYCFIAVTLTYNVHLWTGVNTSAFTDSSTITVKEDDVFWCFGLTIYVFYASVKKIQVKNTFLHLLNKNQSMKLSDVALGKDTVECFIHLPISTLCEDGRGEL